MVVTLIGYRGAGKSTLAPRIASALGWAWLDADVELERRAGRTIKEIFAAEGEAGFRARERELMHELLMSDRLVLAAGGGCILNEATRRELMEAGPVVWLTAPAEVLAARIAGDATTADRRPNLAGGGLEEVKAMLAKREPLYRECATFVCNVNSGTTDELLSSILTKLRTLIASQHH